MTIVGPQLSAKSAWRAVRGDAARRRRIDSPSREVTDGVVAYMCGRRKAGPVTPDMCVVSSAADTATRSILSVAHERISRHHPRRHAHRRGVDADRQPARVGADFSLDVGDFPARSATRPVTARGVELVSAPRRRHADRIGKVLQFFGISVPIVRVGGGLLVIANGWRLVNADEAPAAERTAVTPQGAWQREVARRAFYPLTFPLTVGPGSCRS